MLPSVNSVAQRFGGGLVARRAAQQALQSRQASAEQSRVSPEVSALSEPPPSHTSPPPAQLAAGCSPADAASPAEELPQTRAPPASAAVEAALLPGDPEDLDEALLLSGLLNSAAAATSTSNQAFRRSQKTGQQRPPAGEAPREARKEDVSSHSHGIEQLELSSDLRAGPVNARSPSPPTYLDASSGSEDTIPICARARGLHQPRAGQRRCVPAEGSEGGMDGACEATDHEGVPSHLASRGSLEDAAEEDTVLTGSPPTGSPRDSSRARSRDGDSTLRNSGDSPPVVPALQGLGQDLSRPELPPPGPPPPRLGLLPLANTGSPSPSPARPRPSPPKLQQQQQKVSKEGASGTAREAVRQQLWSFSSIPQGTASIPSKCVSPRRAAAATTAGRPLPASISTAAGPTTASPATHTRAEQGTASRGVTFSQPGAPVPATTACSSSAGVAAGRLGRRQRLEQLARPKRGSGPRLQHCKQSSGEGAGRHSPDGQLGMQGPHPPGAAAMCPDERAIVSPPLPGSKAAVHRQVAPGDHVIAAHRRVVAAAPPKPQPQLQRPADAALAGSKRWSKNLGRQLDATELQRATAAFSEERYQRHLSRLSTTLEARQQRRHQAADTAVAGVDDFVARVHQLGTGPSAGPGTTSAGLSPAGWEQPPAGREQVGGTLVCRPPAQQQHMTEGGVPMPGPDGMPMNSQQDGATQQQQQHQLTQEADMQEVDPPPDNQLAASLTERLLHCQQHLLQRPATAQGIDGSSMRGSWDRLASGQRQLERGRTATCSPGRVKPLMQVKGEQDRALQQFQQQPRPFRASPIPLSTAEPRYQQQQAVAQQQRQEAHEARRQLLLSQQQPFGFEARQAERQERQRQLGGVARTGSPSESGNSSRESDSTAAAAGFHAHPVPVSTTEARYALLVAEMQLQGRSVRGRGLPPSPPRRPATAAGVLAVPGMPGAAVGVAEALAIPLSQRPATAVGFSSSAPGHLPTVPTVPTVPQAAAASLLPDEVEEELGASQSGSSVERRRSMMAAAEPPMAPANNSAAGPCSAAAAAASAAALEVLSGPAPTVPACCSRKRLSWQQSVQQTGSFGAQLDCGDLGRGSSGDSESSLRVDEASAAAVGTEDAGTAGSSEAAAGPAAGSPGAAATDAGSPQAAPQWESETVTESQLAAEGQHHRLAAGSDEECRGSRLDGGSSSYQRQLAVKPKDPPSQHQCVPAAGVVVGTTRSQQLRLESLQYSLAAGRYATSAQRASWDCADLEDMRLLQQPPSPSRPPRQASPRCPPAPVHVPAAQQTQQGGVPHDAAGSGPRVVRLGSRCSSLQDEGDHHHYHHQHQLQKQPGGNGSSCQPVSGCEAAAISAGGTASSSRAEQPGIAVPVHLDGGGGRGWHNELHGNGAGSCHWPASTGHAGCACAELLAEEAVRGAPGCSWSSSGSPCVGLQPAVGSQPAVAAPDACSIAGQQRRDTPPQHIAARHRQAEEAARREVAALVRKRGGSLERLVLGGSSAC